VRPLLDIQACANEGIRDNGQGDPKPGDVIVLDRIRVLGNRRRSRHIRHFCRPEISGLLRPSSSPQHPCGPRPLSASQLLLLPPPPCTQCRIKPLLQVHSPCYPSPVISPLPWCPYPPSAACSPARSCQPFPLRRKGAPAAVTLVLSLSRLWRSRFQAAHKQATDRSRPGLPLVSCCFPCGRVLSSSPLVGLCCRTRY
jgi:hypothetical protein